MLPKRLVFLCALPLVFNASAFAQPSPYVVDGLALGEQVSFSSTEYQQYQCIPSEHPGLTWCHKERKEKTRRGELTSSNSVLHKMDGTAVYVNRYIEPAFFTARDIQNEINRLSAKFGERGRQIRMSQREGFPNAVIAVWGGIQLEQLNAADVSVLASGESPHRGILVGFLGDLRRSAKLGVPVYRLVGNAGYLWAATFEQNGRGVLRFLAIDASQIPPSGGANPAVVANQPMAPPQGPFTWSDCELGRQNPAKSILACTQVLERGPPSRRSEALYNIGSAYFGKGELTQAIAYLNEAIRLGPPLTHRFQERGEVYLERGDFAKAIADFTEAIRLDPTRAFRFHWRGRAYMGIGNLPLAIADFTEAIRLDPVKRSFRFYDRANAFRDAGQYGRAIPDYGEVLQLDPTNGWVFLDRGRTYAKLGEIALTKKNFEAALLVPDVSPELRQAVAEEMATLGSPPPPPPPPVPADVRHQKLSALSKMRSMIEERLPAIHFAHLRRQADELAAKLAAANLDMPIDELDNLSRAGDAVVKRLTEMDEFDRVSSIATRQAERINSALKNVVTDAPYLEEIKDAIAILQKSLQLESLATLQSALGNLNHVYEKYKQQIAKDTPAIP